MGPYLLALDVGVKLAQAQLCSSAREATQLSLSYFEPQILDLSENLLSYILALAGPISGFVICQFYTMHCYQKVTFYLTPLQLLKGFW